MQSPAGSVATRGPLRVNAILAEEISADDEAEPLRWVLLTTEPVAEAEHARQVVRYYELRWRIEDYPQGVEEWRGSGAATIPECVESGADAGDHGVSGGAVAAVTRYAEHAGRWPPGKLRDDAQRRGMESAVDVGRAQ